MLILGGSSEASALAAALAGRADVRATLSLAGRTSAPGAVPIPTRTGGFGGVEGLSSFLVHQRIDVLVNATHPFAAQMSRNARDAARRTGCRLIEIARPAWIAEAGDRWAHVATVAEAAARLGAVPRRVFLTVGRQHLAAFADAPQHAYLVRTIEPPDVDLPDARFIAARGPFSVEAEEQVMRAHAIDVLVTKNSGGAVSAAKLVAARRLRLPVILVARPSGDCRTATVEEALAAILDQEPASADRRGV